MHKKIMGALAILSASVGSVFAQATPYFSMPANFADDTQATLVGVAGVILVVLGLMFAWRKTIKSVNRS